MKSEASFPKIERTVPQIKNETAEYAALSEKEISALGTGVYQRFRDLKRLINACGRGIKLASKRADEGFNEAERIEDFFEEYVKNPAEVEEALMDALDDARNISNAMERKTPVLESVLFDLVHEADKLSEKMPFLHEMWKKDNVAQYRDLGFDVETPEKELAKKLEQLIAEEKKAVQRDTAEREQEITG